MAGTENLKQGIGAVINFGLALEDALDDKKITFFEAIGLISKLGGLAPVLVNWQQLKAEYQDLDSAEREEIFYFFEDEFDLEDDSVEEIVEKAFGVLLSIDEFIRVL